MLLHVIGSELVGTVESFRKGFRPSLPEFLQFIFGSSYLLFNFLDAFLFLRQFPSFDFSK
jgi:hypothetical protein